MDEIFDPTVFDRGSTESIVESFAIVGLYGYRSISLSSPYAASVHIAKNGSGKTTLLAALNAVLKGQFTRLLDLEFSEIRCRIRGVGYDLVLERSQLTAFAEKLDETELARMARRLDLSPTVLLRFLVDDYPLLKTDFRERTDDPIFSAIMKSVSYRSAQAVALCDRLIEGMFDHVPSLRQLGATLRSVLKNVEIIYLPTFRRVELPLLTEKEGNYSRRRRPRFRFAGGSLFSGDIQFGLGDISDRLAELNQRILVDSNSGYRSISANIINELIDGTFDRASFDATELPSKEELTLFFSRLREGEGRVRPFERDYSVPEIDKIYTGEGIEVESNRFLRYFLNKLGTVVSATKDIEAQVTEFIVSCNRYLSTSDDSASLSLPVPGGAIDQGNDDKVLRLNRRNLSVYAQSVASGRKIPLDALSSGEKQMVSLFGKLFLYPNEKIVLIDEPELSLSIEWQRRILPDVIRAPLCRQVIAITHSPFVFDNPLEPFARSIVLSVDPNAPVSQDEVESGD